MFGGAARRQIRQVLKPLESGIQNGSSRIVSHMLQYRPTAMQFVSPNCHSFTQKTRRFGRKIIHRPAKAGRSGHSSAERINGAEARAKNSISRPDCDGKTRSVNTSSPSLTKSSMEQASMST